MKYYSRIGEAEWEITFESRDGGLVACANGKEYQLDLSMVGDGTAFSLLVGDRSYDVSVDVAQGGTRVQVDGEMITVRVEDERERIAEQVASARAGGKRTVNASMPGVVVDLLVAEGDVVEDGQTLLILEAMKMQNPIQAEGGGRIAKVHVSTGDAVAGGAKLLILDDGE